MFVDGEETPVGAVTGLWRRMTAGRTWLVAADAPSDGEYAKGQLAVAAGDVKPDPNMPAAPAIDTDLVRFLHIRHDIFVLVA